MPAMSVTTTTIASGSVAPKAVAVLKAFHVLSAADAKRQSIVTATPDVCIAGGLYVVTVYWRLCCPSEMGEWGNCA